VQTATSDGVGMLFHCKQSVQRHHQITNTVYTQTDVTDVVQLQWWAQADKLCFVSIQLQVVR